MVVVTFGTGVAFGERVGVVGFKPVRIVLRSLLTEEVLAFAAAESDAQVVDVDERVVDRESETRVDVSDGVASVRGSMLPTREQVVLRSSDSCTTCLFCTDDYCHISYSVDQGH